MFPFLDEIRFSDLFLTEKEADFSYKSSSDSKKHEKLPEPFHAQATQFKTALENFYLNEAKCNSDFSFSLKGKSYRIARIETGTHTVVFIVRDYLAPPTSLSALGHANAITSRLLEQVKDGIVLFIGPKGSGKTTSAVAFIMEYLAAHGGTCWTIENPIEIPFEGDYGEGHVFQTQIVSDDDFGVAIDHLFRASADLLFIGEIRTATAIRKAIEAGKRGMIVVATYHANDIQSGLDNFSVMAGADYNFADVLRAVLHLTLEMKPSDPLQKRYLTTKPLFVDNDSIRSMLRNRAFPQLSSEIERQRRFLLNQLP